MPQAGFGALFISTSVKSEVDQPARKVAPVLNQLNWPSMGPPQRLFS